VGYLELEGVGKMNKELAEKVYLFILERINGWSEEDVAELSPSEIYSDPLYQDLLKQMERK
jgi:hypothetical protein